MEGEVYISETIVTTYGLLAHGSLALTYLLNSKHLHEFKYNFLTLLAIFHLFGHILIATSIGLEINPVNRNTLSVSVVGALGHSLLLLFLGGTSLNRSSKKNFKVALNDNFNIINIIGAVGQAGMVLVYFIKSNYKDNKWPILLNIISAFVFLLLACFYLFVANMSQSVYSYCLLAIAGLYLLFLINKIYQLYGEFKGVNNKDMKDHFTRIFSLHHIYSFDKSSK